MINLPGALLMLGAAFLLGVGASWAAGRRGDHRVGVAVSGAIGPVLVAAAYLLAIPGFGSKDNQLSAYVTAPYAVIAGLAGSVLVSALGPRGSRERTRLEREAREAAEHEAWSRAMNTPDEANLSGKKTTKPRTSRAAKAQSRTSRAKAEPAEGGDAPAEATRPGRSRQTTASGGQPAASFKPSTPDGDDQPRSPGASGKLSSFLRRRGRETGNGPVSSADAEDPLDLDDAYASARAYATDTADAPSPSGKGSGSGKGKSGTRGNSGGGARSEPADPIWPDDARPSGGKRRGR
jgi:hypothetical protein